MQSLPKRRKPLLVSSKRFSHLCSMSKYAQAPRLAEPSIPLTIGVVLPQQSGLYGQLCKVPQSSVRPQPLMAAVGLPPLTAFVQEGRIRDQSQPVDCHQDHLEDAQGDIAAVAPAPLTASLSSHSSQRMRGGPLQLSNPQSEPLRVQLTICRASYPTHEAAVPRSQQRRLRLPNP